jgi:hypothetical protein
MIDKARLKEWISLINLLAKEKIKIKKSKEHDLLYSNSMNVKQ